MEFYAVIKSIHALIYSINELQRNPSSEGLPSDEGPAREGDHSHSNNCELKNAWSYTSSPSQAFVSFPENRTKDNSPPDVTAVGTHNSHCVETVKKLGSLSIYLYVYYVSCNIQRLFS